MENEVEVYFIKDKKKSPWKDVKHKRVDDGEKIMFTQKKDSITCSCMLYIQQGFLCRHIFYVFNIKEIDITPSKYILRRWRKDIIPPELFRQTFSNSRKGSKMIQYAFVTFGSTVNKLAKKEEVMSNFLSNLQEYLSEVNKCGPSMPLCSKDARIESLHGSSVPKTINVKNPEGITNKGTGIKFIGNKEKSIEVSKKRLRECALCHKLYHDARTYPLRKKIGNVFS
ncbi:protein FAR1-RELATED SEQUENCE 1-like [Lactuca sativa]|uniref:protein FAR1-RELATED SEQUENCE 1-like n=1 Tax=Lactuca sativa TaxID=4236 RepID=UPI000CD8741C|nr:protein FAR1-RELATED SEQUENCE 1-like [Lactuca sativa]